MLHLRNAALEAGKDKGVDPLLISLEKHGPADTLILTLYDPKQRTELGLPGLEPRAL